MLNYSLEMSLKSNLFIFKTFRTKVRFSNLQTYILEKMRVIEFILVCLYLIFKSNLHKKRIFKICDFGVRSFVPSKTILSLKEFKKLRIEKRLQLGTRTSVSDATGITFGLLTTVNLYFLKILKKHIYLNLNIYY